MRRPEMHFLSVTAHGVSMAYVLTTFFIMGFGYFVAVTALGRPLPGKIWAWAAFWLGHDEEERRQRVMVITEFNAGDPEATLHAMADEILRYRHCVRQLVDAIELTHSGAEFGLIRPGSPWRPKRTPELPGAAPPAA